LGRAPLCRCNRVVTLFPGPALGRAVVPFGVDVLRRLVLFVIGLRLFTLGQGTAVGLAVRGDLVIDAFLLIFELGSFTSR
jgi:hypothetical protein